MPSVCRLDLPGLRDEIPLVLPAEPLPTRRPSAVPMMGHGVFLLTRQAAHDEVGRQLSVEQTGAIDVSRLGDHHGHLAPEEQWGVDLALETVLDLQ